MDFGRKLHLMLVALELDQVARTINFALLALRLLVKLLPLVLRLSIVSGTASIRTTHARTVCLGPKSAFSRLFIISNLLLLLLLPPLIILFAASNQVIRVLLDIDIILR